MSVCTYYRWKDVWNQGQWQSPYDICKNSTAASKVFLMVWLCYWRWIIASSSKFRTFLFGFYVLTSEPDPFVSDGRGFHLNVVYKTAQAACVDLHWCKKKKKLTILGPNGRLAAAWFYTSGSLSNNSTTQIFPWFKEVCCHAYWQLFPWVEKQLTNQSFVGGIRTGDVLFLWKSQKNVFEVWILAAVDVVQK